MNVCPLCLVLYFGLSQCPECSERTHPVCFCGNEWQCEADWSRRDIHVDHDGRVVVHRLNSRCGPLPMMNEAQA